MSFLYSSLIDCNKESVAGLHRACPSATLDKNIYAIVCLTFNSLIHFSVFQKLSESIE